MVITLKDVADQAGVSLATASLALNNSSKVKAETFKRVHQIAQKLNYIPNARAQALVKRATKTIGLIIPEMVNPFFAELTQAIKDTVIKEGYNIILCCTDYKSEEEVKYINMFKSGQVDGAIFSCMGDLMQKNDEMVLDLAKNYIPVVYVERDSPNHQIIPIIKSDLKDGAYQATKYLIELGHREIGFVGQSSERMEGYRQCITQHQIALNQQFVFYNYITIEGGIAVGKKLLKLAQRPTALVCLNDEMAIGVIQALTHGGIQVPQDISIIGTDNIKISNFYNPPLTTINVPKTEMGKKAGNILLKLMAGQILPVSEHYLLYPTELIIRQSTALLSR